MDYGFVSLLPPLVAIALAIAFRQVVIPLLIAILCGAVVLADREQGIGHWLVSCVLGFLSVIWVSITSYDHVRALMFSLSLGAMVGVLEAGGGMIAVANRLATRIRTRRGAQTMITTLGLGIFFDDYANTLLVGGTMRTTADRYGISRAKLAYLVDTTSAPVAGLSPISTWVVTEISYVAAGLGAAMMLDVSAFAVLIASLPFRFYPWLALVMVFTIAASDRDFGPMRGQLLQIPPIPDEGQDAGQAGRAGEGTVENLKPSDLLLGWAAIVPIVGCVSAVIASLYITGSGVESSETSWIKRCGTIISNGDSYGALIHGGLLGLVLATILHRVLGNVPWRRLGAGAWQGALHMIPAMIILWLAWALSDQTGEDQLRTGEFIASWLSSKVPIVMLPTAVFLIAAGVAFSTGTSWGTMAILTPIAMGLAIEMTDGSPYDVIALATLGSVLAGAIFGDHCSPISDTTVLSSRASGCDHLVHVKTQMPYAVSVGFISVVLGTIPVTLGISPYLCLAMGALSVVAIVFAFGKKPD